jgi:hypothetical protein
MDTQDQTSDPSQDTIDKDLENQTKTMGEPILQFFTFMHLPPHLRKVSRPFSLLAVSLVTTLPRNPERTVMLRKLLETKDCAVRALLYQEVGPAETKPGAGAIR